MADTKAYGILGVSLAIGIIISGYLIGNTVYNGKLASNVVTVKGFAERDVKSNLALWTVSFSVSGDDVTAAYNKSHSDEAIVTDFLIKQGIAKDAITVGSIRVTDTSYQYHEKGTALPPRYQLHNTILVRTNNVDAVNKATHAEGDLLKQGLVLTGNTVKYEFTDLNRVKPAMLHDATQNARQAAEQFAKDSNNRVGSIQSANQGFFSIVSRDNNSDNETEGEYASAGSIDKKVRVVTTVTYYLDK